MPQGTELDWENFLSAMVLVLVRVSGMVAFAPFFSSTALMMRTKAVFVLAVAWLLAPLVAALPNAHAAGKRAIERCWIVHRRSTQFKLRVSASEVFQLRPVAPGKDRRKSAFDKLANHKPSRVSVRAKDGNSSV